VSRPVALRGVIEGFYGPPWSHDARLALIEFIAERGMNAYVYAPKSDPRHRDRWREPYDSDEATGLAALAARCRDVGARFGFALSPGLDIAYADDDDRAALLAKLAPLLDGGVDWVVLAVDDIPNRPGLAAEQAALTSWLAEQVDARLSLVPTEYVGTHPSPYLADLAAGLPAAVDVMWTGPTVCSPCIDAPDARGWRDALGDRPLVLWDNYPVNDAVMEGELHLGPYRGRTPALTDELDGVLCNPMLQPHASKVALATAAEFLRDPDAYDEADAWRRAIDDVGGPRADVLGALARACADGPLLRARHLLLHELVGALEHAARDAGWPAAAAGLRDELQLLRSGQRAYADASDDPIASELAPWLSQAALEADAGLAALRLFQQVRPVACLETSGEGRAVAPDAESAMIHAFALLFAWTGARRGERVVAGPRFAIHPAVVQRADGTPGLDVDLALREDESAIDRLCRFALAQYGEFERDEAPLAVAVRLGMELVPVQPDGAFTVPAGDAVVVHAGDHATRVSAGDGPPFPDARLS
jgi:hyaluronoglucosaminidase